MTSAGQSGQSGAPWVQRVYGRLSRRLLAWFLVFALAPLLVTNAIGYRRSATIITELVERFLGAYARLEAQHVGVRAQERLQTLRAVTAGNEVLADGVIRATDARGAVTRSTADPLVLQRYLMRVRDQLRVFDALALFSAGGALVAATDSGRLWGNPPTSKARVAFVEFVDDADNEVGLRALRFVIPIYARDTVPVGHLVASVRRARTAAFLQLPEYEQGSIEGLIFDDQGRTLASSVPHDALDNRATFLHQLLRQSTGAVTRYHDGRGRQRIAAVADIPQSAWRFVAEVSADDSLGPLRRLGALSLLLEFVIIVVLVGASALVAREIVAPLRRLAAATSRVAAGDMNVQLPVRGFDEVAELGHAFNEMTRDLAKATTRVDEMHQREIERASQLATVGELASGLAHEIKNPVIGITNGLDLVRRRHGDDVALAPIFDEMERQLARIGFTVQDLLAFARPATPHLGPVSANDLISRATRLIQPAAERAGVILDMSIDDSAPLIQADADMVHQALVNLLMNAVQATPSGGQIHVRTQSHDGKVTFEIADTGRGIGADVLSNVFRPFFTTRHTGTGLGLSITRGIVERHGGTVDLESTEGIGTTVRLNLPLLTETSEIKRETWS